VGELGFEYMVIGGHRRLAGAKLAGLETLDCIVLNIPPEETHLASLMDNNLDEMDWWDWDLAIEAEHEANPDLTQRELGKRLGVSKSKINNALKIMEVMGEKARGMIEMNLTTPPYPFQLDAKDPDQEEDFVQPLDKTSAPGGKFVQPLDKTPASGEKLVQPLDKTKPYYRISESVLLALVGLKDLDKFDKTLEIVIYDQISEGTVKKIIDWVNKGNDPLAFGQDEATMDENEDFDPFEEEWKAFAPNLKVKYKGGEDYEIHLAITGSQKTYDTAQAIQGVLQGGLAAKMAKFLYTNTPTNTRGKN
jgi:DNA-binding Lrp family transcriptional regulator